MSPTSGFDRIARLYRWLEYATFGPTLQHCRLAQLSRMLNARHALVLGDGDGRFTAALLLANPQVRVVAIDASSSMLRLLARRAFRLAARNRVTTLVGDALTLLSQSSERDAPLEPALRMKPPLLPDRRASPVDPAGGFDLIATHFFLDCLTTADVSRLASALRPRLAPGATWVISEFATPAPWARLLVTFLYLAFRFLTGLRAQRLPAYADALTAAGFRCVIRQNSLAGLLTSSAWTPDSNLLPPAKYPAVSVPSQATGPLAAPSHQHHAPCAKHLARNTFAGTLPSRHHSRY